MWGAANQTGIILINPLIDKMLKGKIKITIVHFNILDGSKPYSTGQPATRFLMCQHH